MNIEKEHQHNRFSSNNILSLECYQQRLIRTAQMTIISIVGLQCKL